MYSLNISFDFRNTHAYLGILFDLILNFLLMRFSVVGQLSRGWQATAITLDNLKTSSLEGLLFTLLLLAALAALCYLIVERWYTSRQIPSPLPWSSDLAHHASQGCRPDYCDLHLRHGPLFWWRMWRIPVLMVGGTP